MSGHDVADVLIRIGREINEIIHAAPLPRLREEDGTEFVARDDLARAVREHILRRIAPDPRPGPLSPLAAKPPAAPGLPGAGRDEPTYSQPLEQVASEVADGDDR